MKSNFSKAPHLRKSTPGLHPRLLQAQSQLQNADPQPRNKIRSSAIAIVVAVGGDVVVVVVLALVVDVVVVESLLLVVVLVLASLLSSSLLHLQLLLLLLSFTDFVAVDGLSLSLRWRMMISLWLMYDFKCDAT